MPDDASELRPAVFFDRDNTLIAGSEYMGNPADVVLVEGAAELVGGVRQMGFVTVTISNQSGVARGYFTENDVRAVNRRVEDLLLERNLNAQIDRHEFCPHHPTHGVAPYRQACQCRKPRDGMLRRAASALKLDLSQSWVLGDAPRDIEAGKSAGCRTILVTVEGLEPSPAALAEARVAPDFRADSLREALWIIAKESGKQLPEATPEQAELDDLPEAPVEHDTPADEEQDLEAALTEAIMSSAESRSDEHSHDDPAEAAYEPAYDDPETGVDYMAPPPRSTLGAGDPATADRIASTTAQILDDLRRQRETPREDFNFFRLLAGVVQVLAVAAVVWALVYNFDMPRLLLGIFLQLLTLTLVSAASRS